jgi:hypothetical protein
MLRERFNDADKGIFLDVIDERTAGFFAGRSFCDKFIYLPSAHHLSFAEELLYQHLPAC